MSATHIYLDDILSYMPDDAWVRVKVVGCDTYYFGKVGLENNKQLINRITKDNPTSFLEVIEITHLCGFKRGLALVCV